MTGFNLAQLWSYGWPQFVLLFGAFATLLTSVWQSKRGYALTAVLAGITYLIGGVGFALLWTCGREQSTGLLSFDAFGNFLSILICLIGLVTVLVCFRYWKNQGEVIHEVFPLFIFASLGMTLMLSTTHLITFVLALELMSLSLYVMVGLRRGDPVSGEAAFKYFLLGSVAAAFLLLGISFLYGVTGTFQATLMLDRFLGAQYAMLFKMGTLLVLLGFAFKVGAVPLHFWAPDVYDGSPVPLIGFMATGVKVAAFGALIRVAMVLGSWNGLWLQHFFTGLAIATMVVGNLAALRQVSLKRIMAYSSISHAGYLLLGLAALFAGGSFQPASLSPILFYLGVYALLTLGVFGVLTFLSQGGSEIESLSDLDGLASKHPVVAALLSIFLISLAGIPPSAGFVAKYYLFSQAIRVGLYPLAIVGILMSAVSLYYYLAPVVRMYFRPLPADRAFPQMGLGLKAVFVVLAIAVFYLGILPGRALQLTAKTTLNPPVATAQAEKNIREFSK